MMPCLSVRNSILPACAGGVGRHAAQSPRAKQRCGGGGGGRQRASGYCVRESASLPTPCDACATAQAPLWASHVAAPCGWLAGAWCAAGAAYLELSHRGRRVGGHGASLGRRHQALPRSVRVSGAARAGEGAQRRRRAGGGGRGGPAPWGRGPCRASRAWAWQGAWRAARRSRSRRTR